MAPLLTLLRAASFAAILFASPASAHEGHDHGAPEGPAVAGLSPRVQGMSGPFQLVAILQGSELVIYLDRADSNEPVTDAVITVETPAGSKEAQAKNSVYRLEAPWAKEGTHDLIFTVAEGDATEIIAATLRVPPGASAQRGSGWAAPAIRDRMPSIDPGIAALLALAVGLAAAPVVRLVRRKPAVLIVLFALAVSGAALAHEGEDHGQANTAQPTRDIAQRLADGTLFVPKPAQRILAIRTTVTRQASHRRTVELPGRVIPDPNASGFVQASVSGRLSPPQGGFPRLGAIVKAGDALAYVTPPFQAIDVSDMRQKAGEIDQQITIVEQRINRYEPLLKSGAVARATYEEAVLELKGLRERRAALDRTRGESERLIAPVSGVIAAVNAVSGQIAETNAVVFQIIDPARLYVEALTFALLPDAQSATARTGEGRTLSLTFQGAGLTDRSQAIPVHYAVQGDTRGLRVGQLVTVLAATGEEARGLALPRTAALRHANGQTIVFEHVEPERFAPRIVRVEPLDADRVLILDGMKAGARIVVQGAELLNQVR